MFYRSGLIVKIYRQSPPVRAIREKMVAAKTLSSIKKNGSPLAFLGQARNNALGTIGEKTIVSLLHSLPDSWCAIERAIIPAENGRLTEIDVVLIGATGVYLIEVKTWKGSFSAYKDRWKRREGERWVALKDSPTEQSRYHDRVFQQWLKTRVADLSPECIVAPVIFLIARWIGVTDCSVPVFKGFDDFLKWVRERSPILSGEQVEAIVSALTEVKVSDFDPALLANYEIAGNKGMFDRF
jgi:hypothetical protein